MKLHQLVRSLNRILSQLGLRDSALMLEVEVSPSLEANCDVVPALAPWLPGFGSLAAEILNRRSRLQCKTMEPLRKHEWVNFFLWVLFFPQHFKSWVRNSILQNIWWWVHLFFSRQSHLARCGRVLVKDNCGRQSQREFCSHPNWSGRPRVVLMKTSSH